MVSDWLGGIGVEWFGCKLLIAVSGWNVCVSAMRKKSPMGVRLVL